MNGSKDIVNFLIEHKINITAKDKQNKTAIEYANENIQEEIVSTLIEMWPKQTKLPLPPNVANIKNRIEEVKIRNQKAEERIKRQKDEEGKIRKHKETEIRKQEEEQIRKQKEEETEKRRKKELELKEFVDELGLENTISSQIFEFLSKEHFDVETLLISSKQDLQLLFEKIKIPFGIQAKIFALIEAKKKVGTYNIIFCKNATKSNQPK